MARRDFFRSLAALPLLALPTSAQDTKKKLHIMMKSAWGTDDETRATFVFNHGLALAVDTLLSITGEGCESRVAWPGAKHEQTTDSLFEMRTSKALRMQGRT